MSALLAVASSQLAAQPKSEPYGVCTEEVADLLRDGGVVSHVNGASRNIWNDAHGRGMVLVYEHEHGYAGPSHYRDMALLERHERYAASGDMWFVVANCSVLEDVQSGRLPHAVGDGEPADEQFSVWFSGFVFVDEEGWCRGFIEDKGVLDDDLPKSMWGMVVNSALAQRT